jgi:broad specificity phosphatase PhoE
VGVAQAEKLSRELQRFGLEVLLSSDLLRAHQTAQTIAHRHNIPVISTTELREVDVGAAEGLGYEEVVESFGLGAIERWRSVQPGDLSFAFKGGETKLEAVKRAEACVTRFLAETDADCVGIVSHGMLMRTLMHYVLPDLKEALPVRNCAYYVLSYHSVTRGWELVGGSVSIESEFVAQGGTFESSEAF